MRTVSAILILALIETLFALTIAAFPAPWNRREETREGSKSYESVAKNAQISFNRSETKNNHPRVAQLGPRHVPPSAGHRHPSCSARDSEQIAEGPQFLRGVNVGGWLILEKWMAPELFDGTDAIDQFAFDQTDGANSKLKKHWESYFTEEDVSKLASYGINAIRIPVGFWAYDNKDTPYLKGADEYLDRAVQWARNNDMKVWVDLHGAPGSQNGFDHSGHEGAVHWQTPENLDRTISVLKEISRKYGSNKYADTVTGIELVNEPVPWEPNEFRITEEWARRAYAEVRGVMENKNVHIIMQDGFEGSYRWINVVKDVIEDLNEDPSQHHSDFAIDSHLYQLFKPEDMAMDQPQHIANACNWRYNFEAARNSHVPVYLGEWSGATKVCVNTDDTTTAGETCDTDGCQCIATTPVEEWNDLVIHQVRRYVEAQLDVWEAHTRGWFYWNFKGTGAWGFMNGIEKGFIPNPVTSRKYSGQCDPPLY